VDLHFNWPPMSNWKEFYRKAQATLAAKITRWEESTSSLGERKTLKKGAARLTKSLIKNK